VGLLNIAVIHVEGLKHMNTKDQSQKLKDLITEIEKQSIKFDFDSWPEYQQTCVEWGDRVAPFLTTEEKDKFNRELDTHIRALLPSEPFLDSYRTGAPKQGAFNKMKGIAKQRLQVLELENESSEVPNPTPEPTTASAHKITAEKKNWQHSPLYYIAVGVIIFILGAFLVYLIKKHFGIPL